MLVLFLGSVTAVGIGLTYILPLFWPDEKMRLIMDLLRILLPYVPLVCAGAILGAALNGLFRFFAPAFAPIVLNVTWILVLPFLVMSYHENEAIRYLAIAVVGGGVLQLLTMAIPLAREGARFRFDWAPRDESLRDVGRIFLPTVFGLALVQINEVVDQLIAEIFVPGDGAVSALYYANLLNQFPLSLVGTSIATAILPGLSAAVARTDRGEFGALFRRGLSGAIYFGLPASMGLILFGTDIVAVIFEHGRFTPDDSARAGLCASYFGVGLWCYCINQVQVRAFHAHKDTRTPVNVSAAMVALNFALNLALVWPMHEAGLALATSISGLASFLILNRILRRRYPELDPRPLKGDFLKSVAATAAMAPPRGPRCGGWVPCCPRSVARIATLGTRASFRAVHRGGDGRLLRRHPPPGDARRDDPAEKEKSARVICLQQLGASGLASNDLGLRTLGDPGPRTQDTGLPLCISPNSRP